MANRAAVGETFWGFGAQVLLILTASDSFLLVTSHHARSLTTLVGKSANSYTMLQGNQTSHVETERLEERERETN